MRFLRRQTTSSTILLLAVPNASRAGTSARFPAKGRGPCFFPPPTCCFGPIIETAKGRSQIGLKQKALIQGPLRDPLMHGAEASGANQLPLSAPLTQTPRTDAEASHLFKYLQGSRHPEPAGSPRTGLCQYRFFFSILHRTKARFKKPHRQVHRRTRGKPLDRSRWARAHTSQGRAARRCLPGSWPANSSESV